LSSQTALIGKLFANTFTDRNTAFLVSLSRFTRWAWETGC